MGGIDMLFIESIMRSKIMGFYGIMVVEYIKNNSSLRCLAGFNERTATTSLKKCLSIIDCSREYWTIY